MTTHEGRPDREATGATKTEERNLKSARAYDTAAGLRRRRAASYRLPPLGDGRRREPLDLLASPRAARCELHITIDRDRDKALVSGWCDEELVRDSGHTPRWSSSGAGWCIDASAVGDVIAEAVRHRRIVEVHDRAPAPLGVVS